MARYVLTYLLLVSVLDEVKSPLQFFQKYLLCSCPEAAALRKAGKRLELSVGRPADRT